VCLGDAARGVARSDHVATKAALAARGHLQFLPWVDGGAGKVVVPFQTIDGGPVLARDAVERLAATDGVLPGRGIERGRRRHAAAPNRNLEPLARPDAVGRPQVVGAHDGADRRAVARGDSGEGLAATHPVGDRGRSGGLPLGDALDRGHQSRLVADRDLEGVAFWRRRAVAQFGIQIPEGAFREPQILVENRQLHRRSTWTSAHAGSGGSGSGSTIPYFSGFSMISRAA
jgi:hypothetical protein